MTNQVPASDGVGKRGTDGGEHAHNRGRKRVKGRDQRESETDSYQSIFDDILAGIFVKECLELRL